MSAEIVELSIAAAERTRSRFATAQDDIASTPLAARFQFWRGASGERYLHTVYGLLDCPPLPMANYILVKRSGDGRRMALKVAQTTHEAETLNLAEIRHRAANLGANEVHVHFLAETAAERQIVDFDLNARLFAGPGAGYDHSNSVPA
jgi:hypothetical protein